jgi:hypothetical protein
LPIKNLAQVVLMERSGSSDTCQTSQQQLRRVEEALFAMLKERQLQQQEQLIREFPSRLLSREVASVRICQPRKELDLAKARYGFVFRLFSTKI